jgi:hypothetical protein
MKRKILMFMGFLLGTMVTVAHATGDRDNLKGLKGVFMVIDPLSADLEKRGVTRDELQTRLVVKLREAGIGIVSVKEASRTPGQPILQLKVASVKKTTGDGFVIQLWMNEKVIFDRDRSRIVHGITWIQTTIAFDGELQSRGIYDSVDEVLNEFINDYLAANPK